jgi:hypothetical protein
MQCTVETVMHELLIGTGEACDLLLNLKMASDMKKLFSVT